MDFLIPALIGLGAAQLLFLIRCAVLLAEMIPAKQKLDPTAGPKEVPYEVLRHVAEAAVADQREHERWHHAAYGHDQRMIALRQEVEWRLHGLGYPLPPDVDPVLERCLWD